MRITNIALATFFMLVSSVGSYATPFYLMQESDPGQPNSLAIGVFDTFDALKNLVPSDSALTPGLGTGFSVAGLANDGDKFYLLQESDPGQPNSLAIGVFDTFDALKNLVPSDSALTPGLGAGVSVAGLAHDGDKFYLLQESDPGQPNSLAIGVFDTFDALKNLVPSDSALTPGLGTGFSVAGLAHDGDKFYLLQESDPGQPNSLAIGVFDTFDALKNLVPSDSALTPGLGTGFSVAGLASAVPSQVTAPEPNTVSLFALAAFLGLFFGNVNARRASQV